MYVCICNAVTDHAIRESARAGVRSLVELRRRTGCGDCCGSCEELAAEILRESLALRERPLPRRLDIPMIAVAA